MEMENGENGVEVAEEKREYMKNGGKSLKGLAREREGRKNEEREVRRGMLEAYGQEFFQFLPLYDFFLNF